MNASLVILPPPARPPLTVAEALRNIAAEALERRRARGIADHQLGPEDRLVVGSAQHHLDRASAGMVFDPLDETQQHRPEVGVAGQQESLLV